MYKNKSERMKENENSQKNTEDQNQCIKLFVEGRDSRPKNDLTILGKRESSTAEITDPAVFNLSMKHLIFFLEQDPRFRRSKLLFKAYMSR